MSRERTVTVQFSKPLAPVLPAMTGTLVRRFWVSTNLRRVESWVILAYAAAGAWIVASPGQSIWAPLLFLVGASICWFLAKMATSWLTVLFLITLALIPVVGWLVLVALILLRLNWLSVNEGAAIASVVIALLPLTARVLPLQAWQSALLLAVVTAVILALTFYGGYSALSMLDVFLTIPAALITLAVSVTHVVGDLTGGGHAAATKQPTLKQPQVESGTQAQSPALEVVKAHVRTSPDGIAQNNLSYTGADKVLPASSKVHVDSYLRTHADGVTTNNLSFTGEGSASLTDGVISSPHTMSDAGGGGSTSWLPIVSLNASVPVMLVPTLRARSVSKRYQTQVERFATGQRRPPPRLRRRAGLVLARLDRDSFFHGLLQPGVSQWQRFKNFLNVELDEPQREVAAMTHVAAAFTVEVRSSSTAAVATRGQRARRALCLSVLNLIAVSGAALFALGVALLATKDGRSPSANCCALREPSMWLVEWIDLLHLRHLVLDELRFYTLPQGRSVVVSDTRAALCCLVGAALVVPALISRRR